MRTEISTTTVRARRVKSALLASAFAVGMAGAAATGAFIGEPQLAFAEPVKVEAPAPADFTTVVEMVKPAVVSVRVKSDMRPVTDRSEGMPNFGQMPDFEQMPGFDDLPDDHPFKKFFKQYEDRRGEAPRSPDRRFGMSQGSGFFVSEDGYLVTNNHVIDGGEELVVVMDDGTEYDAELIGTDSRTDLALLKVEGDGFTYLNFAEENPKVGQWVLAVGNPFGLSSTVTAGILSANGRNIGAGPYDDFLQIDAPVNRGNSGGPTVNVNGQVIGVNTAIFSPSGGNVGIAFAIPATIVQDIVSDLREDGTVTRGWLGVQIQPVTADIAEGLGIEETKGALVADPQQGGPAAGAGIQAGDIIREVDGKTVEGPRELARMIAAYEPDTKVDLTVWRDGREQTIPVTLGELGEQQASVEQDEPTVDPTSLAGLGLTLSPSSDGNGVVVSGIEEGSPAAEKGLQTGDVIVSVGGAKVDDVAGVESQIATVKGEGRKAVLMQVQGERGTRFVAIPLERS
jgi:serine protease Do